MKTRFLLFSLSLLVVSNSLAQKSSEYSTLLWKVTGKNIKEPSYLFGTFHLLTHAFIDTMPAVKNAFTSTRAVAGELVIDAALQEKMMQASLLEGTTLKEILPDSIYAVTADWFRKEAGVELENLNALNPMAVMTVAMAIAQQKHFPNPQGYLQLDSYFQEQAAKDQKKIIGLETIDDQINALFRNISLARQGELLYTLVHSDKTVEEQMDLLYNAYVSQNLIELQQLMYVNTYTPEEIKLLLDDRNQEWMKQLPKIMEEQPTFIAVGALHLSGSNGLIALLQKQGYSVTPVKTII